MSTCNFRLPNTRLHYVIGVGEDRDMEDWEYDDAIENMRAELRKIGFDDWDAWEGRDEHLISRYYLNFYDHENREWDGVNLYVSITGGYYEGAMFDINIDELEGVELSKPAEREKDRIWEKVEKIFEQYTIQIVRVAVFSNGEGVYELANKRAEIKAIVNNQI